MRIKLLVILFLVGCGSVFAQDPWKISTSKVDRSHYYGITVGNGMLGLVSSPEPLKTSCTVLANSYDKFGRGEVSNFLSGFNMLNASLYIRRRPMWITRLSPFVSCPTVHCSR